MVVALRYGMTELVLAYFRQGVPKYTGIYMPKKMYTPRFYYPTRRRIYRGLFVRKRSRLLLLHTPTPSIQPSLPSPRRIYRVWFVREYVLHCDPAERVTGICGICKKIYAAFYSLSHPFLPYHAAIQPYHFFPNFLFFLYPTSPLT